MRESLDIPGVRGSITWHHYTAADVVAFTLTRTRQGGWRVVAMLANDNAFKLAQRPLVFRVPVTRGEWRFPVTRDPIRQDQTWRAELGPIEMHRKETVLHAPLPLRPPVSRTALYLGGGLVRRQA